MHVSLAEALEVRGGPLQEEELWAVLCQSAESLQELLHRDGSDLGFIISPWSLLLMPSGNISFTDENVTQQDLRAFTAPEVLEGLTLSSLSDIEKMHMYSLGMTLFWGADYQVPENQPIKMGEHLNGLLCRMCDDSTPARMSVRTVLDACNTHIRSSSCEPSFSYIRKLVRLVLGSLSQLDSLLSKSDKESLPERSKEIRDRLRGKGLPTGRSAAPRVLERYRARTQEQAPLNRGLSRSMGSLSINDILRGEDTALLYPPSEYHPGSEGSAEFFQQKRARPLESDRKPPVYCGDSSQSKKNWASSVDLACLDLDSLRVGALEDARRGNSTFSQRSMGKKKFSTRPRDSRYSDFGGLESRKAHHLSALSVNSALSSAYDKIKERQWKLHVLRQAMDAEDPLHTHRRYYSDYSSSSESPSVSSSDPDYRQAKKADDVRLYSSQAGLTEHDGLPVSSHAVHRHRLHDGVPEEGLRSAERMLHRQEEELQRLQAQLALRRSRTSLYPAEEPIVSLVENREALRSSLLDSLLPHRKSKNYFGPEFVKMSSEPCVALTVPSSIMNKKGKTEEVRRKVSVVLLNGQRLELSCDIKAVCKDVLDMVVAHVGLVEHHLFGLAYLKDNEFFFVDPDAKLSKVAPEGWKEEPKKKKPDVNFNLFFRIKFFLDDVHLIQHAMTKHQFYLQLRKDILEERMRCDTENAMLLASLALQAEFGDYHPELHGKTYFRLEHYLPVTVLDKMDQTSLKEDLPKLHSTYFGASEEDAEFEFLKVSQRLTEYGVHFHRVLPEKKSQTGIMLGVYSKGVLIFEVLNSSRTPVLKFPWRETKKISFTKKKISLQNNSDGIKHLFQTDSNKTCQYLLQLCTAQHKFHLQMKTRQNNQELQEIENSPLSSLQYPGGPVIVGGIERAISSASLAASSGSCSEPDHMKRISYSEAALNKAPPGQTLFPRESLHSSFGSSSNPKLMSRSHHNLGQVPESSEGHVALYGNQSQNIMNRSQPSVSHQRASSDTDSITVARKQESMFGSKTHSSPSWSPGTFKKESYSSLEETGHAYVVGISMHSPGCSSSPGCLTVNDSLKKKLNALPSPERAITTVNLKKDVKYGLGFQIVGGENSGRTDLGTFVSSITPGGPADVNGALKPGDRLISVNGTNLEGIPHDAAVEILQSTPDDVTLVVSQPKERLYEESTSGLAQHRNASFNPFPGQRQEEDFDDDSSEEHAETPNPPSPARTVSLSQRQHSLSSLDSCAQSTSPPQAHLNGFHRSQTAELSAINMSLPTDQNVPSDVTPPALPPKMRKTKTPELPKDPDYSDRGDSDMDEDTCSSSQDKQKSRMVKPPSQELSPNSNMGKLSDNDPGVNSLLPGDLFDVQLSKKDNSLGISVTGGVNTSVRHGGIYVKAVIPKGAAELDGRIQKGDRVLAVNGKSLEGATHKQAVETLRETGQVVHLLLEKGQFPVANVHAPLTPQSTPPSGPSDGDGGERPVVAQREDKEYSFVTDDNTFPVQLLKNSSGLGFSFSREENLPAESPGVSMVRVKKLFPGQPAAESGLIEVGDVILKVNQTSLKGLSQHEVISALRGTGQEVTLLLCRPEQGVLPELGRSLTPMASPRREPIAESHTPTSAKASGNQDCNPPAGTERQRHAGPVEEALERLMLKNPRRRDSYSDSTDNEEVEKAFSQSGIDLSNQSWDPSLYHTPGKNLGLSQFETPGELDNTIRSAYYSPNQSPLSDLNTRAPSSSPVSEPEHPSQPAVSSEILLLSHSFSHSSEPLQPLVSSQSLPDSLELEDFAPEVELKVSLVKSEKGSLGFTLTKGNDMSCYIHDIIQDPAKSDGRLQPGDRLIMVNDTDVSNMGHTEVVNLVRAAHRVVSLVVGRVLEVPRPPLEAHMLPDIIFQCQGEKLGLILDGGSDSVFGVLYVKDILPGLAASTEGSLRPLDLVHYINGTATRDLTLSESYKLLEFSQRDLILKATRDGKPVTPVQKSMLFPSNITPKMNAPNNINGLLYRGESRGSEPISGMCPSEEQVTQLELQKPESGGLGFSVIGGERGVFVKSITPGGTADLAGTLQVGDRLLKVNEESMIGVSHTKAVATIRKARGLVSLIVSRPPDQTPNTYLEFLPFNSDKINGNIDASKSSGLKSSLSEEEKKSNKQKKLPSIPPIDYDLGATNKQKLYEEDAELSADTDCDGSSLPEDSPETSRKTMWKEESVDDPQIQSHVQASVDAQDDDEITWGSDELPIENINSKFTEADGPIITEDELTSLPLVKVVPDGQYTGAKLNSVVRMLRGLLEQKVPLQEFENLQNLQPLDDCLIGQTKENKKKNRYKNIVPFDTTRVVLGKDGGYINANFIKMPVKDESFMYIACQGPLPTTLADFWQMVWEQKSNVIAMMTQEVEGGKIKCQRYWPDTPRTAEMVDDRLQITLIKDQHLDNFVIRLIEVKDIQTKEFQHVTHLNYTGWPDHGTPTQPEQLLTFISYMRHVHQSGPIITHCSAGIGRSGTLICIDVVLGLISKDADFDISDIVRTMRLQRQGMVQTEEQYIFCYQVVLYVLRCLQAEEKISG